MRTDHENQFFFLYICFGTTEQVLSYNLHAVLRVPVPVGAAAFHFYISYALLLATSYSAFLFQFYELASIVNIPRKILH
jgi:hypothetical protein